MATLKVCGDCWCCNDSMQAERERERGWLEEGGLTCQHLRTQERSRMRNAQDPARHYKTIDSKTLPRCFQVSSTLSYILPNTSQPISYTHEAMMNIYIHTHVHCRWVVWKVNLQIYTYVDYQWDRGSRLLWMNSLPVRSRGGIPQEEVLGAAEQVHEWYKETEKHQTQEEIQS